MNYARLLFALKHIIQKILQELLEHIVPPRHLVDKIREKRSLTNLSQRLRNRDWKIINNAENKGYIDFDILLIYTIIRIVRLDIRPTSDWDHYNDPKQHEISLGDDIERCRRLHNAILHRPNAMVSPQEFNDLFSDFKSIAKRFEIVLKKQPNEFVSQLEHVKDLGTKY